MHRPKYGTKQNWNDLTDDVRIALFEFFDSLPSSSVKLPFAGQSIALGTVAYWLGRNKNAFYYFSSAFNMDCDSQLAMFGMYSILRDEKELIFNDPASGTQFARIQSFIYKVYGSLNPEDFFQTSCYTTKRGLNDSEGGPIHLLGMLISATFAKNLDSQRRFLHELSNNTYFSKTNVESILQEAFLSAKLLLKDGFTLGLNRVLDLLLLHVDCLAEKEELDEHSAFYYATKGHIILTRFHIFQSKSDLFLAEDEYKKAIELYNGYPSANRGLGEVLYLKGEINRALKCLNTALETECGYDYAYLTRGVILWNSGNFNRALADFGFVLTEKLKKMKLTSKGNFDPKIRNFILSKLQSNPQDPQGLKAYLLGYCSYHPQLKTYFFFKGGGKSRTLQVYHKASEKYNITHESINHASSFPDYEVKSNLGT